MASSLPSEETAQAPSSWRSFRPPEIGTRSHLNPISIKVQDAVHSTMDSFMREYRFLYGRYPLTSCYDNLQSP